MQKPTFFNPFTFMYGVAVPLAAATMFLCPARAERSPAKSDPQTASSPAQQTPASSATQDSPATSTPAKTNPDAKPAAKTPAKKAAPSTGAKTDAAKTSSTGSAPSASDKQASATPAGQAATKSGQAGATKAGSAATKTAKAGASKTSTAKTATNALTLKTAKEKQSYAIGINVGKGLSQNLKQSGVDIDPAVLVRGIQDVLGGDKQAMTDQEAQATLTALQADMRKEQQLKQEQLAVGNKKEGEEFLAANKTKEGITTLPDGLQYKILQEGNGPKPTASDSVTVNYKGTLLNGTEFDSSYKRGQPATFNVGGIIKGWTEALQLMPVGSKWQIFIPSDLGYGARGAGRDIGPNATLVFEVELLSIQPKPAAPAPVAMPATGPAPAAGPAANAPTPTPKPRTP